MKRSIKCCGEMGMRQLSGSLAVHGWPQSLNNNARWRSLKNQGEEEPAGEEGGNGDEQGKGEGRG